MRGALDIPLSAEGVRAVEQRAEELERGGIRLTFCGADLPAVQSAEIVACVCGTRARPLEDLREIGLGVWEGLREQEVAQRNPKAYQFWRKNPLSVQPPSGESTENCCRRVSNALRDLAARRTDGATLLVCSPVVTAIVRCITKDVPMERLWEFMMAPASADTIEIR